MYVQELTRTKSVLVETQQNTFTGESYVHIVFLFPGYPALLNGRRCKAKFFYVSGAKNKRDIEEGGDKMWLLKVRNLWELQGQIDVSEVR